MVECTHILIIEWEFPYSSLLIETISVDKEWEHCSIHLFPADVLFEALCRPCIREKIKISFHLLIVD